MSQNRKALLLSALSVMATVMLLGYSAFGWFSMSREITATGMDMSISAPGNLEISKTGNYDDFSNTVTINLKDIVAELNSDTTPAFNKNTDNFFLLPASSFDGLSVWKTDSSRSDGTALCEADKFDFLTKASNGLSKTAGTIKYNSTLNTFEGYYIDVPLWLRTSATTASEITLNSESTVITGSSNVSGIVRMAFLNEDATAVSFDNTVDYNYDNLVYCGQNAATTSVATASASDENISTLVSPKYVNTPTNNTNSLTICSLSAYDTDYHAKKIVVRIWIEGQDSNCIAKKLVDNRTFNIKIGFILKEN